MLVPADVLLSEEQRERWALTRELARLAVKYGDDAIRQDVADAIRQAAQYRRGTSSPTPTKPNGRVTSINRKDRA